MLIVKLRIRCLSGSCRRARTISSVASVELMVEEVDLEVQKCSLTQMSAFLHRAASSYTVPMAQVPQVAAIVVDAQEILDQQLWMLYADPHGELGRRATLSLVVCSGSFLLELVSAALCLSASCWHVTRGGIVAARGVARI